MKPTEPSSPTSPEERPASDSSGSLAPSVVFREELQRYLATLEAVSELAEALGPSVAELDRQWRSPLDELIDERVPNVDGHTLQQLRRSADEVLSAFLQELEDADESTVDDEPKEIAVSLGRGSDVALEDADEPTVDDESPEITISLGRGSDVAKAISKLEVTAGGAIDERSIVHALVRMLLRAPRVSVERQSLLLRSLLTTAVSSFEMLFAGVAGGYFRLHPGAMDISSPEFSLAQLLELDDLQHAVNQAVERRVEDLLRQGLDNQVSWLADRDRLGVDLKKAVDDWATAREVFERRHCIVHHGGRASSQYLAKTNRTDVERGEVLPVNDEYLLSALDQLAAVGIFMTLSAWRRLQRRKPQSSSASLPVRDTNC